MFAFGSMPEVKDSREIAIELWSNYNPQKIAAGQNFTVALKTDGTVVATGNNADGQCNVSDWSNIALPVSK